jgi:hypothetical protein
MYNTWSVAKSHITLVQQKKERDINKPYCSINFEPKDKV